MAKIAIDAGHGLYTAGKRCMKKLDANETREWKLNSRIADKLTALLKPYACEVLRVDDPTGKKDISLSARCKAANDWGADVYIRRMIGRKWSIVQLEGRFSFAIHF